jgi:hypothetical protein
MYASGRSGLRFIRYQTPTHQFIAALLPLSFLSFGYVAGCSEYKPVLQDLEGRTRPERQDVRDKEALSQAFDGLR